MHLKEFESQTTLDIKALVQLQSISLSPVIINKHVHLRNNFFCKQANNMPFADTQDVYTV